MQKEVVRDHGGSDEGDDGDERAGWDLRDQHALEELSRSGPDHDRSEEKHGTHDHDQRHQDALYHAIGARAEEDGRSDRDHDHPGSGCPAERQLKPQRGAEQVSRLVGGVANSNGERHQPECRVAQEWSTKALTDCVAQSRAADDPQASGHFLQNGSSDDREDDGPEQREAVACPGA